MELIHETVTDTRRAPGQNLDRSLRCFGKPCTRSHRIWVSLILDLLAAGGTTAEIIADYPGLDELDIRACIAYGAEIARERYVDIPLEAPV